MRLIDANALLEVMQKSKESSQRGLDKDAQYAYATHDYFMQKINEQPTVDITNTEEHENKDKCKDCAGCTAWKCDCANTRFRRKKRNGKIKMV